jgi:branched-chain amino acid transport system substrate-binding protein
VGTVLYSRGMYAAMLAVEAAKTAQAIHNTPNITPAMMRDGMEALEINQEKLTALGLPNFSPDFKVTCANHGGDGRAMVQQWDAAAGKWNLITDWIQSDSEVIDALILADSEAFAKENNIAKRCN